MKSNALPGYGVFESIKSWMLPTMTDRQSFSFGAQTF